ncbi:MAG TPA: hypothetical protein PLC20_02185 [Flavobacteriales bacterium]|nr:hypothetical protein [Flavobacteriales bacterium]
MDRLRPFVLLLPLLAACGTPEPPAVEAEVLPDTTRTAADVEKPPKTDPSGTMKLEGDFRNGKRHGIWTSYGPDGKVRSRSEYRDGVLHGPSVVFHPNGQPYYTGDYLNGKATGTWRFFDEEGIEVKRVTYDEQGRPIQD